MNKFSVMLVNAPFVYYKTKGAGYAPEGKYPGDPTPILYASNLAMRRAEDGWFDRWGWRPDFGDEVVNPVVWNETVRADFVRLLRQTQPIVVALSGTSPAWPFLREMVKETRRHSRALVLVGGPHMDEMWTTAGDLHPAHPLYRSPELFDVCVSGDGRRPLLAVLEAVAQALAYTRGAMYPDVVRGLLLDQEKELRSVSGRSLVTVLTKTGRIARLQTSGSRLTPEEHGSPYEHFAPRARFPIFGDERTAHVMSTFGCTFHCAFCSERGNLNFRRNRAAAYALSQVETAYARGARKFFFDESVLFSGNWQVIEEFCDALIRQYPDIEWGGQLTVANLTPGFSRKFPELEIRRVLKRMRQAGFTYLYIGLESGSEEVMRHISKAARLQGRWQESVRAGLLKVKGAGIRVGTSVMFGNLGETRETIDETIGFVGCLIREELLDYVSMNLATYHPDTPLSHIDGVAEGLRYDRQPEEPDELYELFEEADPGRVSKRITPGLMEHIAVRTEACWGEALVSIAKVREWLNRYAWSRSYP